MSPDTNFYIFLSDAPLEDGLSDWSIICVEELGLEGFTSQAYRYSLMEFATAIKPSCFKHLLDDRGYEAAIYLDPDIQLFAPLEEVGQSLRDGASVVLTPHLLAPLNDSKTPSDLEILQSGTFNLGFAALRDCEETRLFLDWWEKKLRWQGYNDIRRGMFVDQKWVEFAPSFLERLHIIRDRGYNVAYWNLLNRPVGKTPSGWLVDGVPLTFFHFSGVVPGQISTFSKHQTRFAIEDVGPVKQLVESYLEKLAQNGHSRWSVVPYAYGHFADGTRIPDAVRRFPPVDEPPEDWWKGLDTAYWNSPSERVDQAQGCMITRLMMAIYEARPDIQEKFPLSSETGRRLFHAWFVAYGADEHRIDETHRAARIAGKKRISAWSRFRARLKLVFG